MDSAAKFPSLAASSFAARNPDNATVVVQSKAIRKHLYIGHLVFYHKSNQLLLVTFG
jgi:hypothetical protein